MQEDLKLATNNQANDRYNPPSVRSTDWNDFYYSDLEVDELFWLNTDEGTSNEVHRKINEELSNNSQNLQTRGIVTIQGRTKVYQKV